MNNEQMIKIKNFDYLNQNILKGKILFTGSSLMEQFPICEIARSKGFDEVIYNRGVGGLNTDEFLAEAFSRHAGRTYIKSLK